MRRTALRETSPATGRCLVMSVFFASTPRAQSAPKTFAENGVKWWGKGRWEGSCRLSRWKARRANQRSRDAVTDRRQSCRRRTSNRPPTSPPATPHPSSKLFSPCFRVQNAWSKPIDCRARLNSANSPVQMLGNVYKYASLRANTATER
jgi:hypothetical protein